MYSHIPLKFIPEAIYASKWQSSQILSDFHINIFSPSAHLCAVMYMT